MAPADGGGWQVRGDPDHPSNHGRLCSKGAALPQTVGNDGRLATPEVAGAPASWGHALDVVADGFRQVLETHGPDAVAFYVSGQLLTEDYYVANKLMKGFMGSANIDTNSRLCMASSVAGHRRAFGTDTVPGCYEDFQQAELIVLVGSNTAWCHPVLYRRIVAARQDNPALRVVVVDPRTTATCEGADLHLALGPGTDSILFSGLLAWLQQQGHGDRAFVEGHTEGLDEALQQARWYAPSIAAVAGHCGLAAADVERFYGWFGATRRTVTLYSQGINQTSSGTDKVNAIINCHLLTGRIGRPGMGPFSITGQPNAMGGREVGALANQLACHMDITNAAHRDAVQGFWRSPAMADKEGLKAVDLFRAVERGEVKALWIMATNPAVSMPDTSQVRRALERCELLVVSDHVRHTDTTDFAHVLLPALGWGEKDGTVTSSERTISRQRPFLAPAAGGRPDWWILCEVARRLGYAGFDYGHPREIFTEHARLSGLDNAGARDFDISGLATLDRHEYDGLEPVQWPVPAGRRDGTPRLFGDGRFHTPSGRARFVAVTPRPPGNGPSPDYPLVLNTGRLRDQWHTMTRTGLAPRLWAHHPEPFLAIHPDDALARGVEEGGLVRVSSAWGEAVVRCRPSRGQRPGEVFMPMHWSLQFASAAGVGALVNPITDPVSGQPEFKHTPVAVAPYRPAWHGFLLSRQAVAPAGASYWSRARREGLWHYELAGDEQPGDWSEVARRLVDAREGQWAELMDRAGGHYRGVSIVADRLQSCLFIGPDHRLPARDWLVGLFGREALGARDRLDALAGVPRDAGADAGAIVCACFGVGARSLEKAIREDGMVTTEAIGRALGAGTNCGSCLAEIGTLIARHHGDAGTAGPAAAVDGTV